MLPKTLLKLSIILVFFFSERPGFAQNIIPRFENLGVNDGLPHSSVYSIIQDKRGFMWFGTPDGLCRYDGSVLLGFKYNPESANDIANNFVRGKMFEDKNGSIWYSNESGIYKWDSFKEKIVKVKAFKKNEFANVAFVAVALDDNGLLWLVNIVHGIFNFDIASGKLVQFPLPAHIDYATVLLTYHTVDYAGNIWLRIVSKNEPYIVFNKSTHQYSTQLKNDPPHAIFFSKDKEVHAFEDRLLYKDLKSNETKTILKSINNKKISFYSFDGIRDNYGRLWMTARGNGLFYYDEINDRFQEYHHDNSKIKSLPFDLTTCLYIDRSQNLWIGIDGGGVAKLDLKQPKFNLFPLSEGDYPVLSDYFTKCFYEDEKGRVWFGSHNNGLNMLDKKTNELVNYHYQKNNPNSIPGNIVGGILKDRDGNMWIGSSGGISLFDEKSASFKTIPILHLPKLHPDMNIFVYKMTELKNGDLLAATLLGLVKIIKQPNGSYQGFYFNDKPFLISQSTDVTELADGTVYLTVPGLGLYQLKPEGNSYALSNILLNGIDLRSVRIDERNAGWLWVSSGIGLIHFNIATKKYKLWNEKSGLANSYVYGTLEDEKYNLWISTNGGLSYLNLATNRVDNYSYQDGLQSNEFNTQAFYKSSTNTFYFGGIKGFNWFQSKKIISSGHKPQAAITQIEVENRLLARSDTSALHPYRSLPYDSNDVNFKFAALDFTRPEANRIQYKLEGWDTKWITTYAKSVRYSNLPPGKYTMILKAANAAGVWSNEERVSLIIRPPFYKTWWFYILATIFVFGIIIFITKTIAGRKLKKEIEKLERQKALIEERHRISQEMHDDIGAGLTQIFLISEAAKGQSESGNEIRTELDDISDTSRKLVNNIGEIIWALNPKHDNLDTLLSHLREQLNKLLEYADIEYSINFPEHLSGIELTNKQLRNILLITKEIIHNALKHSKANTLLVTATLINGTLRFEIEDNGTGFNPVLTYNGNGIKNIRHRIEELHGKLEMTSEKEKGTVFIYSFSI